MRTAGFVMLILGLIALVFSVLGLMEVAGKSAEPPFFKNSWFIIMAIFWGGAGLSVLLTFPKEPKRY